jgi:hypothetical protein
MNRMIDTTEQSNKKTKYIKNTLLYITIPFARNLLAFLTLPILTRFLSPADYGTLSLIFVITSFSGIFFMDISNARRCFQRIFFLLPVFRCYMGEYYILFFQT